MAKSTNSRWHRWVTFGMSLLLVVSLLSWLFTRDTLPEPIRIATAVQGGLYYELGEQLDQLLSEKTGHNVELIETEGSQDNCNLLRNGEIDIAIVQAGAVSLTDLSVVAPLHHDLMVVLVRRELMESGADQVSSVADLAGKRIIVGMPESGMRRSAEDVLRHYGILDKVTAEQIHFSKLLEDEEGAYDAAIITTGMNAPNLEQVIETGRFGLLSIAGKALEQKHGHFQAMTIPRELWPPLPAEPVTTISTLSLVVVRDDASDKLVTSLLDCLHEHNFRHRFPARSLNPDETEFSYVRMHPAVEKYHDPLHGFGWIASWLETIAAGRELIVALGAGIFLTWDYLRRYRETTRRRGLEREKTRLTEFLENTLRIERLQMHETDARKLQKYMDEVTEIKLRALDELSHEVLQDHRAFSIFLMQCANLISKIQMKINTYSTHTVIEKTES